ncbi:hypothetical protein E2C01_012490 [Portunus trituberculatus]|uniref:Uncharacterized protein n=1 Tax=Portunus trituberculatus TaxID=210409 RepID=A0A5B7DDS9_PORTR|nr:hypothetical protein [Portunus trituberculatus]
MKPHMRLGYEAKFYFYFAFPIPKDPGLPPGPSLWQIGNEERLRPIAPVGTLEECMGSAVQLLPISGASNFIYSGTHIRAHITTQAHLKRNHLESGYHGDM